MSMPGMTINDLMQTDCLDVDEILLSEPKEQKEVKKVMSMEDFLKRAKGGR